MAFKAEELTTKIFPSPEAGLWLAGGGCPQDTLSKGKPCPQNTCPEQSRHPGDGTVQCPQDTMPTPTHGGGRPGRKSAAGLAALALLQTQLRERLAQA